MDNEEPSIQELVDRLHAGDPEAREVLLCKYLPHLERILTYQMQTQGIQLTCDVHDLCQSVARRFLQQGDRFHFDSANDFFAYLLRTGEHLVERRARDAARSRTARVELDESQWDEIEDPAPGPVRRVAAREQWQRTRSGLAPDERVLPEGRAAGHRWSRIGISLGLSVDAVRKRGRRLLNRLQRKPR